MLYGRNLGQGQCHSREVDCQSPTGLIFLVLRVVLRPLQIVLGSICDTIAIFLYEMTTVMEYKLKRDSSIL